MCWRSGCPFKTRNHSVEANSIDDVTNILIFGITGMTGGAVLDATLGCAWFKVSGFTRLRSGGVYEFLLAKGVTVFSGDMNKPQSLRNAMKDIDTVFLVTNYWGTKSVEAEYNQGVNVVNVAIEHAVKHLIYVGTDYSISEASVRCAYLEGKSLVENYIVSVGIPFTIIHIGFYFENFLSVFKPHRTGKNEFAIALPMGETALNCGSVYDFGCCIGKVALQSHSYMFRTLQLATSYLTVTDIVKILDETFIKAQFYNPMISLSEYGSLELDEAKELMSMFTHYQTLPEWDRAETYSLYPPWRTFQQWIRDNEKDFVKLLYGTDGAAEKQIEDSYLSLHFPALGVRIRHLLPLLGMISTKVPPEVKSLSSLPESSLSYIKAKKQPPHQARRKALKESRW